MAIDNLVVKDARIFFRNFSGRPTKFNQSGGKRSFCLMLDQELADRLAAEGWNVKILDPRDPEDKPQPFLRVEVAYSYRKPHIVTLTSGGKRKTTISEETVDMLDYAEIERIDLSIHPYEWNVNGASGVKAYLKSMYVTLEEDELEELYMDEDWEDQ